MEVIIFLIVFILGLIGIGVSMNRYMLEQHALSQNRCSDALLFKLMTQHRHFMNEEQLMELTSLDRKTIRYRLAYLSNLGLITKYIDAENWTTAIYQLKEEVPLIPTQRVDLKRLSEQEIVEIIRLHLDDYEITIPELVVLFGINIFEAQKLLRRLRKHGLIRRFIKGFRYTYVLKRPLQLAEPTLRTTQPKKKIRLQESQTGDLRLKIPDATVLELAIKHRGKLTASVLCLEEKISIEQAQKRLDDLHQQGVFVIDVDERRGVLEYALSDKSLL